MEKKMNDSNVKREILNAISSLTPLMMACFGGYYMFIGAIPVIINLLFSLVDPIKKAFGRDTAKSMVRLTNGCGSSNFDYIGVSWWLQHKRKELNIKQIQVLNYFTDLTSPDSVTYCRDTYFELVDNTKYKFKYNGIKYEVICYIKESDKGRNQFMLCLSSDKLDDCYDLITQAINEYRTFKTHMRNTGDTVYLLTLGFKYHSSINVKKTRDNVFIENNINIFEQIDTFLSDETYNLRKKLGIPHKIGFLFYGVPGNGKTSLIYALSNYYKKNIYKINLHGMNERGLIEVILGIDYGSIVVFEEIDCCEAALSRSDNLSKSNESEKDKTSNPLRLDTLLEILDGYQYLKDCIIIMTSNHPEKLDSALIRPGRIDFMYEFNYVSRDLFKRIFKYYKDVDLTDVQLDKYYRDGITSSELINQILLPNINLSVADILDKMYSEDSK